MTDQPGPGGSLLLLSSNTDNLLGTSAVDVIQGTVNQLSASDILNGGAGIDTLQITTNAAQIGALQLTGLTSIERLEFTGGGGLSLALDANSVGQATGDVLTVVYGASTLLLNVSAVGTAGQVFLEGTGQVTLRNFANQTVSLVDGFNGNVVGGTLDDVINGGSGADTLAGGTGDDNLSAGSGNDSLSGDDGNDFIDGGLGVDTLAGGLGYDLIVLGQTDTAAGGGGSDTFVIGADATSVTISDFAVSDVLERIDLRAIGTATGFSALTITNVGGNARIVVGGVTITLTGIAAASLTADNFVFSGQTTFVTAAQNETADVYFGVFTGGADIVTGTSGNDVFQSSGSLSNLTSADIINGGAGIDTLRIVNPSASLTTTVLSGFSSIEHLDFTASASAAPLGIALAVDAAMVTQAGGELTVYGGTNAFSLNVTAVGSAGTVKMATFGIVTLRDFEGQSVTVDDSVNGKIVGGSGADNIYGGAGYDSLAGGVNDDNITAGAGNDTLSGDAGNDYLDGGAGNDSLSGGLGYDLIVMGQADTASGGTGSDTFVIGASATTVTVTDFSATDPLERIDLRAIGSATSYAALSITTVASNANITVGGTTLILTGVTAAQLSADDFVFAGQTGIVTAAQGLTADANFSLTTGNDTFTGSSGNDVFQVSGGLDRLSGSDVLHGGAGLDTLRIINSDLSLSAAQLAGLDSVERLDVVASAFTAPNTSIGLSIDAATVTQAGGVFTVYGGTNAFSLDVSTVGNAGIVKMATYGVVTLRNFDGQAITVDDSVNGTIIGGTGADTLIGGLGNNNLSGGVNDDNISGGSGNDTLSGDDGNDFIDGGLGTDSLSGGLGYDLILMGQGDTATGGAGSDTFVIASGASTLTITDFAPSDPLERIDLRAIGTATSFAALNITTVAGSANITVGGATIILTGVSGAQLSPDDFVFAGQTDIITAAQGLTADPTFNLQVGVDNLTGGSGDDVFQVAGSLDRLAGTDNLHGGGGIDTLRIVNSDLSVSAAQFDGLDSIEHIDLVASSFTAPNTAINLSLDASVVSQSGGVLTVYGGTNPFLLDISTVGNAGTVKMATYGLVTLRNFEGQELTVDDSVHGQVQGGTGADLLHGGAGNDSLWGGGNADTLTGGAGNDALHGDDLDDTISGGAGNDSLFGDAGRDQIVSDGGSDTATGGANSDTFVIQGTGSTTITDFSVNNLMERIDLRAMADATDLASLGLGDTPNGAQFTLNGHTVTLAGVTAASLTANDFIFHGQTDINTFYVPAGTDEADLQQLFDEAPAGAIINLGAGEFTISHTLFVHRSDITIQGAGSTQTTFNTLIDDTNASATFTVESLATRTKVGDVAITGAAGSSTIQLSSTAGLSVGSIIYLAERNDDAYLAASGNTGLIFADDYATKPDLYSLREQISKVVAINGNTVTLAEPLAYTFQTAADNPGGSGAWAAIDTPLRNVHISGFQIVTTFPDVDPNIFANTREAWTSIPTVDFDTVTESSISDVAIHNPGSHAFRFQRTYGIQGDHLLAEGAQNKGEEGNGYAFYIQESFNTHLTHLTDKDMRHSVLFSSFSAEHYNYAQVDSTNRDINFHGSSDSNNTVIVDYSVASYGNLEQWPAVGPGHFPIHPQSTVEANTVLFKYLRSGDKDEILHAQDGGSDIASGGGDDTVYGGTGSDLLAGALGDDSLIGGLGADTLNGDEGNDVLTGGAGADSLSGGDGQDILDGGSEADSLSGGLGHDLITLGGGDTAAGGGGYDTFVITGTGLYTVSDFDAVHTLERIDLRAVGAATGLGALTITNVGGNARIVVGGVTLTLTGVAAASLTAGSFVFAGQSAITMAQTLTTVADGFISSNADVLTGNGNGNIFQGSSGQLSAADNVNGGAGIDILRLTGSTASLDDVAMGALISIERIDASLVTGDLNFRVTGATTAQAGGGVLTIFGGDNNITLDSRGVTLGNLIVETQGTVTLRNFDGEGVTLGDTVRGTAVGGSGADTISGGALADTLSGGLNGDTLRGFAGNDLIDGGAGNDTMSGGTGIDTFQRRFGDGSDTITDFTPGAGGDIIVLNGYATNTFAKLVLVASGADTIVNLGQDGQILLKNVVPGALTAANFSFVTVGTPRAITVGATDTLVVGSDGDDTITIGGSHVDDGLTVIGGAGNNTVVVPAGSFTGATSLFGTYTGINTLDFSSATSVTLTFDQAILNQAASKALVFKVGASTASVLDVGIPTGGAKLIIDGSGAVQLAGGHDQVIYGSDTIGVNIGGGAANDQIFGGSQNDHLSGGAGTDKLTGNTGNDVLDGGAGNDTMTGGLGDDTYVVDSLTDSVVEAAGQGTDTVQSSITLVIPVNVEALTLTGSANVNATGSGNADILTGNAGNNLLSGGLGNDSLFGGLGDDNMDGGAGADAMSGGAGNDTYIVENALDTVTELFDEGLTDTVKTALNNYALSANVENLVLTGAADINGIGNGLNNLLTGNGGRNNLQGGAGDDILDGGVGADTMIGGLGNDSYSVENVGDVVTELANEGIDTVKTNLAAYTLAATLENLTLTGSANTNGTGNSLSNGMTGNAGNNVLIGGAGDDTLQGNAGDDLLNGGTGADRMAGGLGNDTYQLGVTDTIIENPDSGIDTVLSTLGSYTLGYTLENVTLLGNAAFNAYGNALDNIVTGNALANILDGSTGKDTISGMDGNDTIIGGTGADILTGGNGNDMFMFKTLADSTQASTDLITDMSATDLLRLDKIDAKTGVAGDQAFVQVSAFTHHAGELVLTYNAGADQTTLTLDVNGDAVADFVLLMTGSHTSSTGWLM